MDFFKLSVKRRSSLPFIIGTIAIALFTDLFLYGVITPILPFSLVDRVGVPPERVQTVISTLLSVYAVANITASSPIGYLADKFLTRKMPMLIGLLFLTSATGLLTIGTNVPMLIIARILQGLSAAVVWTVGLALLVDVVGPEHVGSTMGGIFGFISLGEIIAPVFGGIVYESMGYYASFGMCFIILFIDIVLRVLMIEPREAKKLLPDDPESQPILRPRDDPLTSNSVSSNPIMKIFCLPIYKLISHRQLIGPFFTSFVNSSLFASFDATVPLELQKIFGFNSLQCGLMFGVLSTPYFFCGAWAGAMVDRKGSRTIGTYAYAVLGSTLLLLCVPRSYSTFNVYMFGIFLALNGVVLSFTSSPGFVQSSRYVAEYELEHPTFFGHNGPYTQLFSAYNIVYSLGMFSGPVLAGFLRDRFGFVASTTSMSVLCFSASLVAWYCFSDRDETEESVQS
ncbi:membrane transporter [Schizosaccharomyces octosporus yFS286]|uniref:Membrane transporter n=1 Tax=Schizosaccharomyces octosporus (strain yFS286) TaxID=483514 RepID=S9Q1N0_SCHOY|nr:membrane transporter [Schizosaccharomyces octosporus yFS286]EPX73593.1 membrane transporter [Schizosaccharomyces octosporus yFS286]